MAFAVARGAWIRHTTFGRTFSPMNIVLYIWIIPLVALVAGGIRVPAKMTRAKWKALMFFGIAQMLAIFWFFFHPPAPYPHSDQFSPKAEPGRTACIALAAAASRAAFAGYHRDLLWVAARVLLFDAAFALAMRHFWQLTASLATAGVAGALWALSCSHVCEVGLIQGEMDYQRCLNEAGLRN